MLRVKESYEEPVGILLHATIVPGVNAELSSLFPIEINKRKALGLISVSVDGYDATENEVVLLSRGLFRFQFGFLLLKSVVSDHQV